MKVGVYFVLYLAVVLEILIIIVDRDDAEDNLKKQIDALIPFVVTPPTGGIESQVYRVYVDANDTTGIVRTDREIRDFVLRIKGLKGDLNNLKDVRKREIRFFSTREVLSDSDIYMLARRDTSIVARGVVLSFELLHLADVKGDTFAVASKDTPTVQILSKKKSEDPQLIDVPLIVNPKGSLVGVYEVWFDILSDQVHFIPEGSEHPDRIQFGNVILPYKVIEENVRSKFGIPSLTPELIKEKYDQSRAPLYIAIIDSSKFVSQPQLKITPLPPSDRWAMGNEIVVPFSIEGAESRQIVDIGVSSGGTKFGSVEHLADMSSWWWKWVPPYREGEYDITFTVTGLDNRGAGSKSISLERTFTIKAVLPVLNESGGLPDKVCQNEPFTVNVQVTGLDNTDLYRLVWYINDVKTDSVRGPMHEFSLSDLPAGTRIRVEAFYNDKEYYYYDAASKNLKRMEWSQVVSEQDVRIGVTQLSAVGPNIDLPFSVYRACDITNIKNRRPCGEAPQVRLYREDGEEVTDTFIEAIEDRGNHMSYLIRFVKDSGKYVRDKENGDNLTLEISACKKTFKKGIVFIP